jgi:hypothetical protein
MGAQVCLLKNYMINIVMFNVYQEPRVIKNFITHEECEFLISFENENLHKSGVLINSTQNLHSKSRECFEKFHEHDSHEIVTTVLNKCSKIVKKPVNFFERVHIVKYKTGGYYNCHQDATRMMPGYDRTYTIIIYLNDEYEGGETNFPLLNKSYKLSKGDALFFHNYNTDLSYTSLSTHEACIVKSGEKYVANFWIHSKQYS